MCHWQAIPDNNNYNLRFGLFFLFSYVLKNRRLGNNP